MSAHLLATVTLLVVYAVTAGPRFGHLSLISLFIYAQATMALGTLPSLGTGLPADEMHQSLIASTFALVTLTAIVYGFALLPVTRKRYQPVVDWTYPRKPVWGLVWVSIGVCAAYYAAVGYFAILESFRAVVSGDDTDLAALRLESYAGSRYLFPGYVNQFKNALLPALTIVVIASGFVQRTRSRALTALALASTAVLFLVGTGQRGAFVASGVVAAVSVYLMIPQRAPKIIARLVLLVVPVFFLSTFASGRATRELAQADGISGVTTTMFEQLAFRLLGSNQLSSTVGFRYIYDRDVPFASEWAESLAGLMPGHPGSDLSNQVFAVLYGSTRGTAPLSIWGSAYHNLGFVGSLAFAAVLSLVFCLISARINELKQTDTIQLIGGAGVTVALGTWIAGAPDAPLNSGLAVFVALWVWGKRRQNHELKPDRNAAPRRVGS